MITVRNKQVDDCFNRVGEPGSGAFLTPDSWIEKSGYWKNIRYHNSESRETIVWLKLLKFFEDPDPGSFSPGIRDEKFGSGVFGINIPDCSTEFNLPLKKCWILIHKNVNGSGWLIK